MTLTRRQLVLVTIGILMSNMLSALDTSIVATAMPRIVTELAGLEYYAWVTTAYLVTSTTIIPISGKMGDLFGRKRFLQGGMVGFLLTSVLCGLAQSMPQLVIARAVQGIFGGFLTSSAIASMADLYAPATRAKMQGVFMSVFAFTAIVGPVIGGILTDQFGWRSVFLVNIPLGLVSMTFVALTMPRVKTEGKLGDIDVRGALLLTAGIVPLLTALTAMRESGIGSPVNAGLLVIAVVMLGAFVIAETRVEHPIMPLDLFRNRTFTVAIVVSFLTTFAMFGSNIFVPLLYQGLLGLTATESGLYLAPRMVAMVVASLVSGQIVSRIDGYRFIGVAGLVSLATGLFLMSQITPASSEAEVMRDLVLIGLGFGSNQPIWQNAVMSAVPHRFVGVSASQVHFWRSLGQTVGVTVLGAVLAAQVGGASDGLTQGLHLAFLVAAGSAAVATLIALLLKEVPFRRRAARAAPAPTLATQPAALGD